MKKIYFLAAILFGVCLIACYSDTHGPKNSFYFWKQGGHINTQERRWLDSLQVGRIYMRVFDIDIDTGKPTAVSETKLSIDSSLEVVPVVFITERTLRRITDSQIDSLAAYIANRLFLLASEIKFNTFQVDCDWTGSSKLAYFRLLSVLKRRIGANISLTATIRLHQWARPSETGVPPVDAGVLMCYNTGQSTDWEDTNAILSVHQIKAYVKQAPKYPLPLAVALPVFSWARIWRDGLLIHLVHGATATEIRQQPILFVEKTPQLFESSSNQYWHGHYLYRGDLIRIDTVSAVLLQSVAEILSTKIQPEELIWYHLDSSILSKFEPQNLKNISAHWNGI